jgi:hypothetical protein
VYRGGAGDFGDGRCLGAGGENVGNDEPVGRDLIGAMEGRAARIFGQRRRARVVLGSLWSDSRDWGKV